MNNSTRINSSIGKRVENIKVAIKRANEDFKNIECKENKNQVDYFLLKNGSKIIERANEAISLIKDINYYGLIERSMKRNEICLGRIDEGNLRARESIEIGSIKNISYNLIEEDIFNYLIKIRRRNNDISVNELVNVYVESARLNQDSKWYLEILLLIPFDLLRQWKRYMQNRNQTEEEFLNKMKKAYNYEIGGNLC